MPTTPLDVRIRIGDYTAVEGTDQTDDGKDLIFNLQVNHIRRELADRVEVMPMPQFKGALTVPFPTVLYTVTLQGRFFDTAHTAHPVASGATTHVPDFIDLEEMAVTWNGGAPGARKGKLVWLELDYTKNSTNSTTWRVYRGVILKTTLMRTAGHWGGDFVIEFGVIWEPSASFPDIREWA